MLLQDEEYRKAHKSDKTPHLGEDVVRFKWRRQSELFPSLLNNSHEASAQFQRRYLGALVAQSKSRFPLLIPREVENHPERLNPDWAAKMLGKSAIRTIQQVSWLNMLLDKKLILIDTPDYSKTDRRLMARDLDEIYWLWNTVSKARDSKPNFVVAIQKEMFRDHFFFDKMEKIELDPLEPGQMVGAYRKRFSATQPFTEDGLLTLARMSRGIFRRFLKYINLTLTNWESTDTQNPIDVAMVKKAVSSERLTEDMELEFQGLFPKQSELKFLAVRLLLLLQEASPRKQSELARIMDVEPFAMSRLLGKLESSKHVTRSREGNDKLVSLAVQ
jgi:DNA-binding transcriptional ArsR family regulator